MLLPHRYDPRTNQFYVTGNNDTNSTRFFDVVNDDGTIAQTVDLPTTSSAHSITVDPFNGDVFVALAGADGNTVCPWAASRYSHRGRLLCPVQWSVRAFPA